MTQEVHAFIGAPGSGKSTLAAKYDRQLWVVCNFDSLRASMWPPNSRVYWNSVRTGPFNKEAQRVLHGVQNSVLVNALENGFNLVCDDTNTSYEYAKVIKNVAQIFDIQVQWFLLDVPWNVLVDRNKKRIPGVDQIPLNVLESKYAQLWDENAWWRSEPNVNRTTITLEPLA